MADDPEDKSPPEWVPGAVAATCLVVVVAALYLGLFVLPPGSLLILTLGWIPLFALGYAIRRQNSSFGDWLFVAGFIWLLVMVAAMWHDAMQRTGQATP